MEKTRRKPLRRVEFDQFQRYGVVALLLKPLVKHLSRPVRILEVGANRLRHLEEFLRPLPVTVTYSDVEDCGAGEPAFVRLEPDRPLPFTDGEFDFVVALEVLEHLPRVDRRFNVAEWLRVAGQGVLLTCPDGGPAVAAAEARASRAFMRRRGEPHRWLMEHEEFGRPTSEETTTLLEQLEVAYRVLGNSPVGEWLPLLLLSEEMSETGDAEVVAHFNHMLNRSATALVTQREPYRRVYCCFKDEASASKADQLWSPILEQVARAEARSGLLEIDPLVAVTHRLRVMVQRQARELVRQRELATRQQNQKAELSRLERARIEMNRRLQETEFRLDEAERLAGHLKLELAENARSRWQRVWQGWAQPWRSPGTPLLLREAELIHVERLRGGPPTRWESLSDDPQFLIELAIPPGMVRIEVAGRFPRGACSKIYCDHGSGFNESQSVCIGPWDAPGRRVIHMQCPQKIIRLRFDPMDCAGPFDLWRFDVRPSGTVRGWMVRLWERCRRWLLPHDRATVNRLPTTEEAQLAHDRLERALLHPYSAADRRQMAARLAMAPRRPSFSVFIHANSGNLRKALSRSLRSLRAQSYLDWELLIGLPLGAPVPESDLDGLRASVIPISAEKHSIAAWSEVLTRASCDYLLNLEAGDSLVEDALLALAEAVVLRASPDLLYADEVEVDAAGKALRPILKPGWSPEVLREQPDVGRLAAYRRGRCQVVCSLGTRSELHFGAAFVTALLQDQQPRVAHVPRCLNASLSDGCSDRRGPDRSSRLSEATPAIRPPRFRPIDSPRVSIVIPTAGREGRVRGKGVPFITNCLESLRRHTTYGNYEILVVDNGRLSSSVAHELERQKVKRMTVLTEFNFAANLNRAAQKASGDYFLFLNDDVEVISPDWIEGLLEYGMLPGVGAVGGKLFFPDGRLQHVGVVLVEDGPIHHFYGFPGDFAGPDSLACTPRNYLAVTGACLMTPRRVFHEAGGFEERFPLNYNDVDYCLRLHERGMRMVFTPHVQLYHYERMGRGGCSTVRPWELELFRQRWGRYCGHDPFDNFSASRLKAMGAS